MNILRKKNSLNKPKLLKAAVYGANDGIITTFAVVAGVSGANLSSKIVLILGIANMFADAISMGLGDFLGERSIEHLKKYFWQKRNTKIWQSGLVTFFAFIFAGTFPLLPYLLESLNLVIFANDFLASSFSTAMILFVVGSARSIFTKGTWWKQGLEMLSIGAIAASVAYLLGAGIRQLI